MSEEETARELVDKIRDEIRGHLAEAGDRRARAIAEEREWMREITKWAQQGEGILSVAEMAQLARVAKETIYTILKPTN